MAAKKKKVKVEEDDEVLVALKERYFKLSTIEDFTNMALSKKIDKLELEIKNRIGGQSETTN